MPPTFQISRNPLGFNYPRFNKVAKKKKKKKRSGGVIFYSIFCRCATFRMILIEKRYNYIKIHLYDVYIIDNSVGTRERV